MSSRIYMTQADIIDRYTILLLKAAHSTGDKLPVAMQQLQLYSAAIDFEDKELMPLVARLAAVNRDLWEKEARLCELEPQDWSEDEDIALDLIRASIAVRQLNRRRCEIKNEITQITKDGYEEIKLNYAGR